MNVKKTDVMIFYDKSKGGLDVVDLISSSITTRMKTKRWPMNAFAFSLDTARTNARTLFNELREDSTSESNFHFSWNLGKSLILPQIEKRYQELRGNLPAIVVKKMCKVLEITNVPVVVPLAHRTESGGRCYIYYARIKDKADYKAKRNKLNNHLKTFCSTCTYTVCKEHSVLKCHNCDRRADTQSEEEEDN